jgi:uncharacterized membrane protein
MSSCPSCGASFAGGTTFCPACSARSHQNAGLHANLAAALTYLAGILTGILFLVIEPYRKDRVIRFHAFQSIYFNLAWIALWFGWTIAGLVLGAVAKELSFILQAPIDLLLMVGGLALWVFLMFTAHQGKMTRLPLIGALAAKQAGL